MKVDVDNYINVENRCIEFNINIPSGITILPNHFDSARSETDLNYSSIDLDIERALMNAGVTGSKIKNDKNPFRTNLRGVHEWISPIIFISTAFYSQNTDLVSIAINVISNYITDFFKLNTGKIKKSDIHLEVVVEIIPGKTYKHINYHGDVDGIKKLPDIIRKL